MTGWLGCERVNHWVLHLLVSCTSIDVSARVGVEPCCMATSDHLTPMVTASCFSLASLHLLYTHMYVCWYSGLLHSVVFGCHGNGSLVVMETVLWLSWELHATAGWLIVSPCAHASMHVLVSCVYAFYLVCILYQAPPTYHVISGYFLK